MKWSIQQKVFTGFAVALAILAVVGWLAYQSTLGFMQASTQATRSQETITALEEIFSLANQAETRQRNYLISGDERHLAPRSVYIDRIHALLGNVRAAMLDHPGQQALLSQLEQHIDTRLALLEGILKVRREQGFEQARFKMMAGNGEREMDAIHDTVVQMKKGEAGRLQQWVDTSRQNADRMLITFIVALVSVAIFFSVLFTFIAREMAARQRSQEQLARQAEQLREGEARLRAVVDTAVEGIIVIDEQGIVESYNPAAERIFGFARSEVEGRNISMLMPAPYRQEHDGYLEHYLSTGEKKIIGIGREVAGQHKGGRVFPLELAVAEMNVNGHRKFTGMVRDISERKLAEEQKSRLMHELEGANEELKSFAYVVSHDLKAPLRAIGSLADWLSTDYVDKFNDEGKEHMRLLVSRVHRMGNLIDGILQYSRVGRVKEVSVAVDLNRLVREVIDLLAPPANIAVSVENPLPTIMAEPTRIQQVFQNLLSNAIKYMDKPEGEIRIACSADGKQWKFSVSDNGPGIESRHFERIFQLFQTLAPRDRVESTGVGLTLVKKIVEMYGGRIWVESRVGEGSTFFFTLPNTAATASSSSSSTIGKKT
jgi:two-component system sensor kinase FixL